MLLLFFLMCDVAMGRRVLCLVFVLLNENEEVYVHNIVGIIADDIIIVITVGEDVVSYKTIAARRYH